MYKIEAAFRRTTRIVFMKSWLKLTVIYFLLQKRPASPILVSRFSPTTVVCRKFALLSIVYSMLVLLFLSLESNTTTTTDDAFCCSSCSNSQNSNSC